MAATIQEIDQEMEEIKMLMKLWLNFYRILTMAFEANEEQLKASDPEFQHIKTVVAEHHDHFMKVIKKDPHIGQSILTTVKRTISLDGFNHLSNVERDKTMIDWHKANILLNETMGSLECEKDRIIRKRTVTLEDSTATKVLRFLKSPTFKNIFVFVALVAIIGFCYLNWETIEANEQYQQYLKPMVDKIGGLVGIEPAPAPEGGG